MHQTVSTKNGDAFIISHDVVEKLINQNLNTRKNSKYKVKYLRVTYGRFLIKEYIFDINLLFDSPLIQRYNRKQNYVLIKDGKIIRSYNIFDKK